MASVDEQQPLLRPIVEGIEGDIKHDEVILDFEAGDPENPREWTAPYQWMIVLLLASMSFTVTFTCISVVPIAGSIVDNLEGKHASSSTTAILVTIWELGEAAGPLLIAPLSELFGRYPVVNVCNVIFIIATLLAAGSQSTGFLIAARMLTGFAVSPNVLGPSIVGDMFESEKRGSAMSLMMLAPLIGGAVGPSLSGVIAQTMGWRSVLVIAAGLATVCELLFLIYSRETYKMAILRRRATKLRIESGEFPDSTKAKGKHEDLIKLRHALTRPFAVLFGSGVLLLLSLYTSVSFTFFYIMSISLPIIVQDVYGFNPAQTGSSFISFSVGSFLGVILCNMFLDKIYVKLRGPNNAKGKPEYRLPLSIFGALLLPLSVTAYGWVAEKQLPVALLLASVAMLGFTMMLAIIPLSAYVVDTCGLYSASAMTGVIVTRCLMGTFLPLTTGPLTELLGYGWGFSCLGALSMFLAVIPMLLFRYGEAWRQRSEFTRDS